MKSSNILLNEQRVAKISDFGLSRTKAKDATMTRCGSPLWCAPEILKGVHFDEKCDVYGYGIILWEALAWKEPWVGIKMMQVINNVVGGKRPEIPVFAPEPIVQVGLDICFERWKGREIQDLKAEESKIKSTSTNSLIRDRIAAYNKMLGA